MALPTGGAFKSVSNKLDSPKRYASIRKDIAELADSNEIVKFYMQKEFNLNVKKIMEKMGYIEGKGLGKHHQGIISPVKVPLYRGSQGIGSLSEKKITGKKKNPKIICDYFERKDSRNFPKGKQKKKKPKTRGFKSEGPMVLQYVESTSGEENYIQQSAKISLKEGHKKGIIEGNIYITEKVSSYGVHFSRNRFTRHNWKLTIKGKESAVKKGMVCLEKFYQRHLYPQEHSRMLYQYHKSLEESAKKNKKSNEKTKFSHSELLLLKDLTISEYKSEALEDVRLCECGSLRKTPTKVRNLETSEPENANFQNIFGSLPFKDILLVYPLESDWPLDYYECVYPSNDTDSIVKCITNLLNTKDFKYITSHRTYSEYIAMLVNESCKDNLPATITELSIYAVTQLQFGKYAELNHYLKVFGNSAKLKIKEECHKKIIGLIDTVIKPTEKEFMLILNLA